MILKDFWFFKKKKKSTKTKSAMGVTEGEETDNHQRRERILHRSHKHQISKQKPRHIRLKLL